ncbi:hypothetical protein LTR67_004550 [Exophiala xenobiotica]
MSGLEVIGGISAVIGIIEASIKIYDSARKDLKLGETFEAVRCQLPIILDTLQTCKNHLETTKDSIPTDVCKALEEIVDMCDEKARKLREIFDKVIPGQGDGWKKQYLKILKRLGNGNKGRRVDDIHYSRRPTHFQSANPEQRDGLDNIIKEMNSLKSSGPEEENAGDTFNSGGGAQTNNVNSGSGQQINNHNASVGTQNFGSVNTIHKPPTDFSFRGPVGPCLSQAPTIDPSFFVGRRSEIDAIRDILKPGGTRGEHRRLVLGGMGGIEAALKDSFRSIAELIFDVQEPAVLDDERIHVKVGRWLSHIDNTRWLLIFDNYDDPTQFKIEKYYPQASHGTIIITTRLPDKVADSFLKLGPLRNKIEDGLEILQSRSRRQNVASDPDAKRLAERLAGLPLALATAGAYLHKIPFTFERYLSEYENRFEIDSKRPLQLQDYQDRTLCTTWDISYSQLQEEDPIAAKLLKLLAYFDNQILWYELFSAGFNPRSPEWLREVVANDLSFASVMGRLTEYCFIELQMSTESWSMHNCIHDWTLAMLNKDLDGPQLWYAFDCVAASIKDDDWDSFERLIYNRLAAHATRLVRVGFQGSTSRNHIPPNRLEDAQSVAYLLRLQIRHEPAEQLYRHVLAGMEQELGPTHIRTLRTFNNVGNLYYDQGKLEQAEEYYLQALTGKEQALGPTHPLTLVTVNNLGGLYSDQGKLEQAEKYYLRALVGKELTLGLTHLSTLATVNNLGNLYRDKGNLQQAEKYYLRAFVGREEELGPTHQSTLDTLNNLGNLYSDQGKLEQAEKYYLRALVGKEQELGPTHPSTLATVNNLGLLYTDQGNLIQAEKYCLRALMGYEQALGPTHPSTLDTVHNLGVLYYSKGNLVQAEEYCLRALVGKEQALGLTHPSTLNTINNLGRLYYRQGKLVQAEEYYRRALAGYKKNSLSKTIPALNTISNLGRLFRDQGKAEEARAMLHRALSGRQEVLGPDHSDTLKAAKQLEKLRLGKEMEEKRVETSMLVTSQTVEKNESLETFAPAEEFEN